MANKISRYLSASAALLLLLGCREKEMDTDGRSVLTARLEKTDTRVSFDDVQGKLTWTDGDEVAVHVGSDYVTASVDPDNGRLAITETASTYRNYYAVYPASAAVAGSYGNTALKVTLPATYDITDIVAGTSTTRTADYSPVPMVAVNNTDNSILQLRHVGGLLRITLAGVKATTQKVRVTFDKDVTGEYIVSNPDSDAPTIRTAGTAANNVVTYTLAASSLGATIAAGNIVLNVPVPCGVYHSVTVETLNASGTAEAIQTYDESLVFARHHGKRLAFGELTMEFYFGSFTDADVVYSGGAGTLASSFTSYKTPDGGETKTAVPFTLEYFWDKEGTGEDWYTTPPSWLDASAVNTAGSTSGEEVALTASAQVNSEPDSHHIALAAEMAKSDFDLSTINVATGETVSRTTANCYVVQAPGTYKFPLVYGNGVVNNAVNESAYRGKDGVSASSYRPDNGATYYLGSFKDHLDQNIHNSSDASHSSPYLTTHLGKAASDFKAVLLWQDVPGLISVNPTIIGSGEDSYLSFSVPSETITQGNALVAVLVDDDNDGTPETIAWSWHIWVTEEDLTAVKAGPNSYFFAPVNIGWCEGKKETYEARSCQVRATQGVSGKSATATLTQTAGSITTGGNNPYYQGGRKDPLQASTGIVGSTDFKRYYSSADVYAPQSGVAGKVSIGTSIQNPHKQYTVGSSGGEWCSTTLYNKWSSTINGTYSSQNVNAGTKTIYDPSPVGYIIPSQAAFSGFNTSNFVIGVINGTNGRIYNDQLFFPATGGRQFNGNVNDYVGIIGYCWTTIPGAESLEIIFYVFTNSDEVVASSSNRGYSFPVRSVVDD